MSYQGRLCGNWPQTISRPSIFLWRLVSKSPCVLALVFFPCNWVREFSMWNYLCGCMTGITRYISISSKTKTTSTATVFISPPKWSIPHWTSMDFPIWLCHKRKRTTFFSKIWQLFTRVGRLLVKHHIGLRKSAFFFYHQVVKIYTFVQLLVASVKSVSIWKLRRSRRQPGGQRCDDVGWGTSGASAVQTLSEQTDCPPAYLDEVLIVITTSSSSHFET